MADNKEYMTLPEEKGSIHIAEDVLATIAVGAVREVEGVSGIMSGSMADLMSGKKSAAKAGKGVKIDLEDEGLVLDLYVTVNYGSPIPEVAENAQKAVAAAIEAMAGCTVRAVNIHVGGVTLA